MTDVRRDSHNSVSQVSTAVDGPRWGGRPRRSDLYPELEGPKWGGVPLRDDRLPIRPPSSSDVPSRQRAAQRSPSPSARAKSVYIPLQAPPGTDRLPKGPAASRPRERERRDSRSSAEWDGSFRRNMGPVDSGWPSSRMSQTSQDDERRAPGERDARQDNGPNGRLGQQEPRRTSPVDISPPNKRVKTGEAEEPREDTQMGYKQQTPLPDQSREALKPLPRETAPSDLQHVPVPPPPPPSNADWSRRVIVSKRRHSPSPPPPRGRNPSPIRRRSPPPVNRPPRSSQRGSPPLIRPPPAPRGQTPPRTLADEGPPKMLTLPIRGPPGALDDDKAAQTKAPNGTAGKAVSLRDRIEGANDAGNSARVEVRGRQPVQTSWRLIFFPALVAY
jgi:hypothetical protein